MYVYNSSKRDFISKVPHASLVHKMDDRHPHGPLCHFGRVQRDDGVGLLRRGGGDAGDDGPHGARGDRGDVERVGEGVEDAGLAVIDQHVELDRIQRVHLMRAVR